MNVENKKSETALHYAVEIKDNFDVVKLLIEKGAYMNVKNNYG